MNRKKFIITFLLLFVFLCGYFFNSTGTMAQREDENNQNNNQEDIDMIINYNEDDMVNKRDGEMIANIDELVLVMVEEEKNLTYDVYQKTNLSVEEFNKVLAKTALAGQGESFKALEDEFGVNGIFAIAVSIAEAGWDGRQANKNNFYGMRGANGYLSFNTPKDNTLYFGELITKSAY